MEAISFIQFRLMLSPFLYHDSGLVMVNMRATFEYNIWLVLLLEILMRMILYKEPFSYKCYYVRRKLNWNGTDIYCDGLSTVMLLDLTYIY